MKEQTSNYRCPYCSDGAQNPYYALRSATLPPEEMLELLRRVRKHCSFVVLTGGEPLQFPGLRALLRSLPKLRYRGVVFTTNGYDLHEHLDAIAGSVTELVVSLDTLDHDKVDAAYKDGVLTVTLPKTEQAKAKTVKVKS